MSVRLGYACISVTLREEDIYTSRTMRINTMKEKGVEAAREMALRNIDDLKKIILYNEENGIRFFRITSNLFPHMENPLISKELTEHYNLDFAREKLAEVGQIARELGHRLTFHPGQYAQLGSPKENVVEQTFRDLNLHANIALLMGLTPALGTVLIIHGGGVFGDKEGTMSRWKDNFRRLPSTTQQFIVIENDEFSYSPQDLLPLCEELDIPLCLDFFHYKCMFPEKYNELLEDTELLDRIARTWVKRGIKQKVHASSQRAGVRRGTHDDYIDMADIQMDKILQICKRYNSDIMCECGAKDLCMVKVREKFFEKVSGKRPNDPPYWVLKNST